MVGHILCWLNTIEAYTHMCGSATSSPLAHISCVGWTSPVDGSWFVVDIATACRWLHPSIAMLGLLTARAPNAEETRDAYTAHLLLKMAFSFA